MRGANGTGTPSTRYCATVAPTSMTRCSAPRTSRVGTKGASLSRARLGAAQSFGRLAVDREAVLGAVADECDGIDLSRRLLADPAFEHVFKHSRRVAATGVAIAAATAIEAIDTLADLELDRADIGLLVAAAVAID